MELRVSDVKQWFYCPRIVYYRYCLPVRAKPTEKMVAGAAEHEVLSVLERRRSLRPYGLSRGQRFFHVPLTSEVLGLSGVLDLLILTDQPGQEEAPLPPSVSPPSPPSDALWAWVVEFKFTAHPVAENHRAQLGAYCLLVEDCFGTPVAGAFLYRHPHGCSASSAKPRLTEVAVTERLRNKVRRALEEMRTLIGEERMPPATPRRGRCADCEYRRFCGEVV